MYSIPYPSSSQIPPIKVPYVALFRYSLSGPYRFDNFLDHIDGLLLPFLLAGDSRWQRFESETELEVSLLQTWLFFGLASEALGRDVDHNEFLEKSFEDGRSNISIDIRIFRWFWIEFRRRWEHLRSARPKEASARERERLTGCLTHTFAILYLRDRDEAADGTLATVYLSVRMLYCVITDVIGMPLDYRSWAADPSRSSTQVLLRRMIEHGWCRKRLNFVNAVTIPYPCLYYLSSISPSHGSNIDHSRCTTEACSVSTVLQAPHHRVAGCPCQDIRVPIDKVNRILQDDSIPLIRVKQTRNGLQLEVVRYTAGTTFTAISHVWSDRRFGSSNNALPQCQLDHLQALLAKLPVPFEHRYGLRSLAHSVLTCLRSTPQGMSESHKADWLFWLDTFCIPQDPTQDHLRRRAIDMMNLVYGAASQTLILDAGLQDFDAGQEPASDCEVGPPLFFGPARKHVLDGLAQVCGSHWMGRAW